MPRRQSFQQAESANAGIVSAKLFDGERLFNSVGEEIGKVREVVIDHLHGRLAYVLAERSLRGADGLPHAELVPMPWTLLTYDSGTGGLRLSDAGEAAWGSAEALVTHPIDWQDRVWAERLHEHYGVQPYWTVRSP